MIDPQLIAGKPAKCLDCLENDEPYDGPCDACGWYTASTNHRTGRRIVKHDQVRAILNEGHSS